MARRWCDSGGIGWNTLGHEKWVHGSPKNESLSDEWRFLDAEMWAPAWSTCQRDGRAPDAFVGIRNERSWHQGEESVSFNPVVLVAVATDLGEQSSRSAVRAAPGGVGTNDGCLVRVSAENMGESIRRCWIQRFHSGSAIYGACFALGLLTRAPSMRRRLPRPLGPECERTAANQALNPTGLRPAGLTPRRRQTVTRNHFRQWRLVPSRSTCQSCSPVNRSPMSLDPSRTGGSLVGAVSLKTPKIDFVASRYNALSGPSRKLWRC